jgi:hypothetical protein
MRDEKKSGLYVRKELKQKREKITQNTFKSNEK